MYQGFDFMRGLGTVINVALLIFGGLCGLLFGKKLSERIKDTLLSVNAVAIMMLAVGGVMQNMLSLQTVNGRHCYDDSQPHLRRSYR